MKVAVIIIGRIDFLNKDNYNLNLSLFKDSDIFFHTDFDYKKEGMKLKPKDFIFTKPEVGNNIIKEYKNKYKLLHKKVEKLGLKNNKHYGHNFDRVVQWWRYNECINEFKLQDYDYVVKWRTDASKVYPLLTNSFENLVEIYGSLKGYIEKQSFNKDHLYMFRDLIFFGSPEVIKKVDFYSNVEDYIGNQNENIQYSKSLIDKCDVKSGRFQWLEYENRPFLHLFSSETAMIKKVLSENIIIKDFFK